MQTPILRNRFFVAAIWALCCLLIAPAALRAQTDTSKTVQPPKTYVIETKDGGVVIGEVVSDDGEQIVVKTKSMGTVTIARSNVQSITEGDGSRTGKKGWRENPNASRYVAGPSAIPQRKGTGYYQNMYLFLSAVNYGITDHISVAAGTELVSLFEGNYPGFISISPRIGYEVLPKLYFGGGLLYTILPGYPFFKRARHDFLATGLVTYGSRDNNITLGIGWTARSELHYIGGGNYEHRMQFSNYPTFNLSAMCRPAKWLMLVTENWLYSYPYIGSSNFFGELYFSAGARIISKNFSFDFGVLNNPNWFLYPIPLPYLGFTLNFQTKKSRTTL